MTKPERSARSERQPFLFSCITKPPSSATGTRSISFADTGSVSRTSRFGSLSDSGASFQSVAAYDPFPRNESGRVITRAFFAEMQPTYQSFPYRRAVTRTSPTSPVRTRVSSQYVGTNVRKSKPGWPS